MTALPLDRRRAAISAVNGPDEDWGDDPYFLTVTDPHPAWKKVLIVHANGEMATFRSITKEPSYMPKKLLHPGAGWWLDNSMLDANDQQARAFLQALRQMEGKRAPTVRRK